MAVSLNTRREHQNFSSNAAFFRLERVRPQPKYTGAPRTYECSVRYVCVCTSPQTRTHIRRYVIGHEKTRTNKKIKKTARKTKLPKYPRVPRACGEIRGGRRTRDAERRPLGFLQYKIARSAAHARRDFAEPTAYDTYIRIFFFYYLSS